MDRKGAKKRHQSERFVFERLTSRFGPGHLARPGSGRSALELRAFPTLASVRTEDRLALVEAAAHTLAAVAFFCGGHGLLFVGCFARRSDGALAIRGGITRVKALAVLLSPTMSAPFRLAGLDLAGEYLQIFAVFLAMIAFERDVARGARALDANPASVAPEPAK